MQFKTIPVDNQSIPDLVNRLNWAGYQLNSNIDRFDRMKKEIELKVSEPVKSIALSELNRMKRMKR